MYTGSVYRVELIMVTVHEEVDAGRQSVDGCAGVCLGANFESDVDLWQTREPPVQANG